MIELRSFWLCSTVSTGTMGFHQQVGAMTREHKPQQLFERADDGFGHSASEGIPTSRLLWVRILTAWAENATISPVSYVSFHGSDWMVSRSICRMGFPSRCGIVVLLGRDPRGTLPQALFASTLFFTILNPNSRINVWRDSGWMRQIIGLGSLSW